MAESISIKIPSKELEHFSRDLFNYIWQKYSVNCQSLNEAFSQMLKNDKEHSNESEAISPFNEDIGVAVLYSQCLLREFCWFYFKFFLKHRLSFVNCLNLIVDRWMEFRTDVFLKVIDFAAIVAELVLYYLAEHNCKVPLEDVPIIFMQGFQNIHKLEGQFFGKGGWKHLKEVAYNDFIFFTIRLSPFVNFRSIKYERLDYNCESIRVLVQAPVLYPVENSKFCPNCLVPSKTTLFSNLLRLKTSGQDSGEKTCKDVSTQKGFLKEDLSPEEALNHSMSKCQITQSSKIVLDEEVFFFKLCGNVEDVDKFENKAVNVKSKAEKLSKKKSKTKS